VSDAPADRGLGVPGGLAGMGKLLGEFADIRAGALVTVAYLFAGLGVVLVAVQLFNPHESLWFMGLSGIVIGAVCFAVGKFRAKNRLLLFQEGIVQMKGGRVEPVLWREVQELYLEQETRYSSGLAYGVRYRCSLQRKDGTRLGLNSIRLTSAAVTAIRQSAPVPILYRETATVVDGRHPGI
jgi:uncharacterized protein DUF6585